MEETKSKRGGRMNGDVIAKSTKARTSEIHTSKEVNDRLRLIFHAVETLSTGGVVKEAMTYHYE
jgi:hypothetical protein